MEIVLLVESLPFIPLYFTIVGNLMRFLQICYEIFQLILMPTFWRVLGILLDVDIIIFFAYLYTELTNLMRYYFILTAAFFICITALLMDFMSLLCELVEKVFSIPKIIFRFLGSVIRKFRERFLH